MLFRNPITRDVLQSLKDDLFAIEAERRVRTAPLRRSAPSSIECVHRASRSKAAVRGPTPVERDDGSATRKEACFVAVGCRHIPQGMSPDVMMVWTAPYGIAMCQNEVVANLRQGSRP